MTVSAFQDFLDATPLSAGIRSWAVTALKELLAQVGTPVGNDTVEYDDALVQVVGPTFTHEDAVSLLARL